MSAKPAQDTEVQIHPVADEQYVNIESLQDIHVTAANDETIDITNDRTITVDGTHTETIKGDTTIKITDGNLSHDVASGTGTFHVKGEVTENYDADQNTTVANDIIIISKSTKIHITAATEIQLQVGASTLLMKSDGSIQLSGKNIAINATEKVGIAAPSIASEASNDHTTSGMLVVSKGSTSNTVQGGMVMLNP